jgi:hypothetical protein
MEIQAAVNLQRIEHIISSYQLRGNESEAFRLYLDDLLTTFPAPLIELAMVETLVINWLKVPMAKGREFLSQVHEQLQAWEDYAIAADDDAPSTIASTITPEQFQQITGLSPAPIFGFPGLPPSHSARTPLA